MKLDPILSDAYLGRNVDPERRATAREALKAMKPSQRLAIVPPGLGGMQRTLFISQGILPGDDDYVQRVADVTQDDDEAPRAPRVRTRTASAGVLSAADVARSNKIDPKRFRAFLRTHSMPRTFATADEGKLAVRKFQAHSKRSRTADKQKDSV